MATAIHICVSVPHSLSSLSLPPANNTPFRTHGRPQFSLFVTRSRTPTKTLAAAGGDLLGDFGGRDPFPAEVESEFGDKVLGNVGTEHKILIPNVAALSLAQQDCSPISPMQPPMAEEEAQKLLRKVVGWRLLNEGGRLRLQCLWKLRDFKCGVELINRIYDVVAASEHFPDLHLENPNQVRAELWTASIGGLSMNDFIVATKIDEIKTSDLLSRKRVWA